MITSISFMTTCASALSLPFWINNNTLRNTLSQKRCKLQATKNARLHLFKSRRQLSALLVGSVEVYGTGSTRNLYKVSLTGSGWLGWRSWKKVVGSLGCFCLLLVTSSCCKNRKQNLFNARAALQLAREHTHTHTECVCRCLNLAKWHVASARHIAHTHERKC